VWTNSVRNAFRKQAGRAKLQEARAAAARHWTERVWYRHNQHWLQATREGTEASKSGGFKDERGWGKKCFEDLDAKKQVYTMATAEKVAPGSDWHFSVRAADAEVWLQENSRVHTV
jgi:hypothetical protein